MSSIKSPCLGCEERHKLCHSSCEKYLSYRAALTEKNRLIRKQKSEESSFNSYVIGAINKAKVKRNIRSKHNIGRKR